MPPAPYLAEAEALFAPYLQRWRLTPDGDALLTPSGALLPVRQDGQAAMLKVSQNEDERLGAQVMRAWKGAGSARVLEFDGDGLLLERGGCCTATCTTATSSTSARAAGWPSTPRAWWATARWTMQ